MSCSTVVDVCGLSFEFRSMNQLKYLCGLLLYCLYSIYGFVFSTSFYFYFILTLCFEFSLVSIVNFLISIQCFSELLYGRHMSEAGLRKNSR